MSYHETDPWQQAAANVRSPEGKRLKCSRGNWSLDGVPVDTGPNGLKVTVIMSTALWGAIAFENGVVTGRRAARYEDVAPSFEAPEPGWEPLTEVLAVLDDDELATFTGTAWGARRCFERLIKPYLRKGKQAFPVCELSVRERGDVNHNVDPVLLITGWAPRDKFRDLLSPETPRPPALETNRRPLITSGRPTPPVEDEVFAGVDPSDAIPF